MIVIINPHTDEMRERDGDKSISEYESLLVCFFVLGFYLSLFIRAAKTAS